MPKKPAKKKKKLSIAKFEVTDTTLEAQFNDIDVSGKISRDYGSPSNRLWGYSGVITAHSGGITSSLRLTSVGYPTLAAAQKSVADLRESFTPIALNAAFAEEGGEARFEGEALTISLV